MTDNPFRPTNSISTAKMTNSTANMTKIAIHWKPVLIGFAIGFIGSCILAVL